MNTCTVMDCGNPNYGNGLCRKHWMRNRRRGTTDLLPRPPLTPEHRAAINRGIAEAVRIPVCHPMRQHAALGLCRACYAAKRWRENPDTRPAKAWQAAHPDQSQRHRRKSTLKKLGVTPEQYDALWLQQQGKCANRRCDFTADLLVADFRRGLQVDHDHVTGAIRGLLCPRCNTALGHINDDKARLLGLIEYLDLMI